MKTVPHVPYAGVTAVLVFVLASSPAVADPRFPFLTGRGPVNSAMKTIWDEGFQAPQTTEAASAAASRIAAATRVLQANQTEAQRILLSGLQAISSDDLHAFRSLDALVRLLGDDREILGHLGRLLMTAPPRPPTTGDDVTHPGRMVRQLAVSQIADAAKRGSRAARALLPQLVASPDRVVVVTAVRAYYSVTPNRRLAQRALRQRMPVANRHLLYVD